MTALPEPVGWEPPVPGYWMRNFRLGEWLPEAMTPLFADWLLGLIEDGYLDGMRSTVGAALPFPYSPINSWYYASLPEPSPRLLARAVLQRRGRVILLIFSALIRVNKDPVGADRAVLRRSRRPARAPRAVRRLAGDNSYPRPSWRASLPLWDPRERCPRRRVDLPLPRDRPYGRRSLLRAPAL